MSAQLLRVMLLFSCVTALTTAQQSLSQDTGVVQPTQTWRHARERLQQWKTLRLLQELGLDETRGTHVLLRYMAYNRRIDSLLQQLENTAQQLATSLHHPTSPEELQRRSQELLRQQQELFRILHQRAEALRPLLTEEQFARYVLFEYRFPQQVEQVLFQRWHKRQRQKP